MNICKLKNFNKTDGWIPPKPNQLKLNKINLVEGEEIEKLELYIERIIRDAHFNKTPSNDPEYVKSINDLCEVIGQNLDKWDLDFVNPAVKGRITKFIKSMLLPRPLTKAELWIQANVSLGDELITEDERLNQSFLEDVADIYGSLHSVYNTTRLDEFDLLAFKTTVINNKTLITDDASLNQAIEDYQKGLYTIMYNYLKNKYNLKDSGITQSLINNHNFTKGYRNLFTLMRNVIVRELKDGKFLNHIKDGWVAFVLDEKNNESVDFYQAVNAYVNLTHFDQVIYQALGKYINVNDELATPITIGKDDYNIEKTEYKYSFARGNAFAVKSWNVKDRDALSEMAAFSRVLIKNIPVYSYNVYTHKADIIHKRMELKDFVNTMSRLLDMPHVHKDLRNAIQQFLYNPRECFLKICTTLFEGTRDGVRKSSIESLMDNKFDNNYINYLYSIYHTLFKGKDSWNAIEQQHIRENGLPLTYPIIDTLLGVANSSVANNYLLTNYNYDSKQYETTVKAKYNDTGMKFDLIRNINASVIDYEEKQAIIDLYKMSRVGRTWYITVGDTKYEIAVGYPNGGILFKKETLGNDVVIGPELKLSDDLSDKLNSVQECKRLLEDPASLNDEERLLMANLRFIDLMLQTNFTVDTFGLLRFRMIYNLHRGAPYKEMFLSAVRGRVITNLYYHLDNDLKADGSHYSRLDLQEFLNDHEADLYPESLFDIGADNKIFYKRVDGMHLSTVYSGERWLTDYAYVDAILTGTTSRSTISNIEGDKIPNYSPLYLGARIESQIALNQGTAAANLLFRASNPLISSVAINTDVLTRSGERKLVKKLTNRELLYDSIVNKFIVPVVNGKPDIYVQPTTYADKVKFPVYGIRLKDLLLSDCRVNSLASFNFSERVESKIGDTIGKMYKEVCINVVNDYKAIFNNEDLSIAEILQWLTSHTREDLNKLIYLYNTTHGTNLAFGELHFRPSNGHLTLNESVLHYGLYQYEGDQLHKRLQQERRNFVLELFANRVELPIVISEGRVANSQEGLNAIGELLLTFVPYTLNSNPEIWVNGTSLLFAKIKQADGTVRDVLTPTDLAMQEGDKFILNPILERYFLLDNLIGNNLRLCLTGTEANHPVKQVDKMDLRDEFKGYLDFISRYNPTYKWDRPLLIPDIQLALLNAIQKGAVEDMTGIREKYESMMIEIESNTLKTQMKRNVPIPGTIRPYLAKCIDGIGSTINVAVMDNMRAPVFNFSGRTKNFEVHDGAAFESPITSINENRALQDNEVGTLKKPLQHYFNPKYGTATLLKYAITTITNASMVMSDGNNMFNQYHGIQLHHIFKKMHNVQWKPEDGIDLIDGCEFKSQIKDVDGNPEPRINFFQDILLGQALYYLEGNQHYHIIDIGRDEDGTYYTIEQEVDGYGDPLPDSEEKKVYHYYDRQSNHIKLLEKPINTAGLHTINSLYELHSALGGIYSESAGLENALHLSEASNYAVANYTTYISRFKRLENESEDDMNKRKRTAQITLEYYDLPLKRMLVDVVADGSAVKNGASNVNSNKSYYDDSPLLYMLVGTAFYGIQLDADHTADDARMTEASQVINALDSGGYLHDYVALIYETLGKVAILMSQVELDAIAEFKSSENKSKLFDIIGRTMIANLAKGNKLTGLAAPIIASISRHFNSNIDHAFDRLHIPFSDPNIYSRFLPIISSSINQKSIKRKYSGLGFVLTPGYNIAMVYELNGKKYQFSDLLKLASGHYTGTSNRDIVRQYLADLLALLPTISRDEVLPVDNLLVTVLAAGFNIDGINTNEVDYEVVSKPWGSNPAMSNPSLRLYVKGHKEYGYFELVKDKEREYYSVHFKTGNADTRENYGSSTADRQLLYKNLIAAIPEGALVSTWGNVSRGGVIALTKIGQSGGFNYFGNRAVINRATGEQMDIPIYKKGTAEYQPIIQSFDLHVSLDAIEDYYSFMENPGVFLAAKYNLNMPSDDAIRIRKDITVPRNLAPTRLTWSMTDKDGNEKKMNIFTHWRLKGFYKEIADLKKQGKAPNLSELRELQSKYGILKAFMEIKEGNYIDEDGTVYKIYNLQNQAAEGMFASIYKSKFGIKDGDSLNDIIEKGPKYFATPPTLVTSNNYDMAFLKADGKHQYVTFKPMDTDADTFDAHQRYWSNTIREKYVQDNVRYKIYAATKDNIKLFEIGREIVRDDLTSINGKIYRGKKLIPNKNKFSIDEDGKVLERVEFITRWNVEEVFQDAVQSYSTININRSNLKRCFNVNYTAELLKWFRDKYLKPDENYTDEQIAAMRLEADINHYIGSKLLPKIYETEDFVGVQLNSMVDARSHRTIKDVLLPFGEALAYNEELSSYLRNALYNIVNGAKVKYTKDEKTGIVEGSVQYLRLGGAIRRYFGALGNKKFSSFLRSLGFTASRIPALDLQSFMQIQNVGFVSSGGNEAYCSHWEYWLQGSDNKH